MFMLLNRLPELESALEGLPGRDDLLAAARGPLEVVALIVGRGGQGEGGEGQRRVRPVSHVDVDPGRLVRPERGRAEGGLELDAGAALGHVH